MWLIDKNVATFFFNLNLGSKNPIMLFSQFFDNQLIFLIFALILFYKNKKMFLKFTIILILVSIYVLLLKYLVSRPRPFTMFNLNSLDHLVKNASFPSGHTTFSFLFAFFTQKNYSKNLMKVFIWILAILISLSRIVILAHYVSDVLFSFIFLLIIYCSFEFFWNKYFINTKFKQ